MDEGCVGFPEKTAVFANKRATIEASSAIPSCMNANESVEHVAEELARLARPGSVVLVDSDFFSPLVDALRTRTEQLQVSVRTAHFTDPVELLVQALVAPTPTLACCPEAVDGHDDACLHKAHMLLEQLGIRIIETHTGTSDPSRLAAPVVEQDFAA